MDIIFKLLLALLFYGLMAFFYLYYKGKIKVKEEKRDKYLNWIEKNGERSSKAITTLVIIFSILFVFNLIAWSRRLPRALTPDC